MEGAHRAVENLVWLKHASQQNKPDDVGIYRLRAYWYNQTSLRGDPVSAALHVTIAGGHTETVSLGPV
jgi:hypothetical protein